MIYFATGNSFVSAYVQSDGFGKAIFLALFFLSAISWSVITYKVWIFLQVKRLSASFSHLFSEKEPLNLQFTRPLKERLLEVPHPFFEIYKTFKQHALAMINRNHFFAPDSETFLSEADLELLASQVDMAIASQQKHLEKNLFVLSTAMSLAPFLGLLGTVWGILITFSQLQTKGFSTGNAAMLSGLSLALATTVVGLVIAIPALIAYNYLRNGSREYRKEMEYFSHQLLTAIELQYRRPSYATKTLTPS